MNVSVVPDSSTSVDPSGSTTVKPATSSSAVSTETVWSLTPWKLASEIASMIEMEMLEVIVPSIKLSSTPVTVTVCGVFQFTEVNVSDPEVVASPASLDVKAITTSEFGCASRTTVNVSVPPASVTAVEPSSSTIVNPATSSSTVKTATVWSGIESKSLSLFASSIEIVIDEPCSPSMMLSSIPVTVTVCGVSQSAEVKVIDEDTEDSPVSLLVSVTTTFEVGCASSTTVNVSVPPASVTSVDPSSSTMVNPATSSSVFDAFMVWS